MVSYIPLSIPSFGIKNVFHSKRHQDNCTITSTTTPSLAVNTVQAGELEGYQAENSTDQHITEQSSNFNESPVVDASVMDEVRLLLSYDSTRTSPAVPMTPSQM